MTTDKKLEDEEIPLEFDLPKPFAEIEFDKEQHQKDADNLEQPKQ